MKARQIRDIGDPSWEEIKSEAEARDMKVGEYLVAAHRLMKSTPAATGKVAAVTPLRTLSRVMFTCRAPNCDFHTALDRACPRHPQAGLKKVS